MQLHLRSNDEIRCFHSVLSAYFNQDWIYQYRHDDGEKVVDELLNDIKSNPAELAKFSMGLTQTLQVIENHPDIKILLKGFGQNYDPNNDNLTMLEWYINIKRKIRNLEDLHPSALSE